MSEKLIYHGVQCRVCKQERYVQVRPSEMMRFWKPNRTELVQDIFPDMSLEARELLISGTCESCWNEMFPPDEEEE